MAYLLRQACVIKSAVTLYCQSTARYSIAGHNWTVLVSWIKEVKSGWDGVEASLGLRSRKPSEIPLAFTSKHWAFTRFFNSSGQKDTCGIIAQQSINHTESYFQKSVIWLWALPKCSLTWAWALYLWNVINTCRSLMTELNNVYKV